jgi:hypothetical protein
MVVMRTGGKSTHSLKSNLIILKENIRACRENGVYTNFFIVAVKYIIKIFEFAKKMSII